MIKIFLTSIFFFLFSITSFPVSPNCKDSALSLRDRVDIAKESLQSHLANQHIRDDIADIIKAMSSRKTGQKNETNWLKSHELDSSKIIEIIEKYSEQLTAGEVYAISELAWNPYQKDLIVKHYLENYLRKISFEDFSALITKTRLGFNNKHSIRDQFISVNENQLSKSEVSFLKQLNLR